MDHSLKVKWSKCLRGKQRVENLKHIISANPSNVACMLSCTKLRTVRELHNFLGLTSYYCIFVAGYEKIVTPLIGLLKKDVFEWTDAATKVFEELKLTMVTAQVLALTDFTK
ncbi:uncharacterized mitochondrial protein AtMg00860-like [Typha angustifolia]|uniref:uncharacterized mitochondrial protein AtMg00860-like n=1 Tax=Typha angustifolia TaxID=59011 RepID=UPI003C2DE313